MNHQALAAVVAATQKMLAAQQQAADARLERDQALWDAHQHTGMSARLLSHHLRADLLDLGYPVAVLGRAGISHDTVRNAVEGHRPPG